VGWTLIARRVSAFIQFFNANDGKDSASGYICSPRLDKRSVFASNLSLSLGTTNRASGRRLLLARRIASQGYRALRTMVR
jgi:hypothetical protein